MDLGVSIHPIAVAAHHRSGASAHAARGTIPSSASESACACANGAEHDEDDAAADAGIAAYGG